MVESEPTGTSARQAPFVVDFFGARLGVTTRCSLPAAGKDLGGPAAAAAATTSHQRAT